jgi:Abortive infection C-terminus
MVDAPTLRFMMHGARAAIAGGMLHIEEQVAGIECAVVGNPGLAFDRAKTLIESACRPILTERRIAFDPGDDLPKLFKAASQYLPFLPVSASGAAEIRKSLTQTRNGLHTAIQGICELRNKCGFTSHGTDGPRPALEAVQALLAAEAADAIVGFLHRVHQQDRAAPESSPITYDENPEFNNYVDEVHERVRIFDEEFEPSRILFELAPEPYRVYLTEFQLEQEEESGSTAGDDVAEAAT